MFFQQISISHLWNIWDWLKELFSEYFSQENSVLWIRVSPFWCKIYKLNRWIFYGNILWKYFLSQFQIFQNFVVEIWYKKFLKENFHRKFRSYFPWTTNFSNLSTLFPLQNILESFGKFRVPRYILHGLWDELINFHKLIIWFLRYHIDMCCSKNIRQYKMYSISITVTINFPGWLTNFTMQSFSVSTLSNPRFSILKSAIFVGVEN